ncbi:amino acid adenylation domain-containing protein [Kitasatospora sp. NPDC058162]|uniref:non-ribosomal peptide synthetase n=1 Tax=Kitasatospora sp. NPDC058162 TaxID=3346362 RepID=UPI0036DF1B22
MTGTHVAGGLVTTAAVGLVRLPCDRWLANQPVNRGSSRTHPVPEPVLARFLRLAEEAEEPDGGPDAVLAAVLAVLLHHYAGQQDVQLTLGGPEPVRVTVDDGADLRRIRQQLGRQVALGEGGVADSDSEAEAPLTIRLRPADAGPGALLEAAYDPALLDEPTAARVLEHAARLLAALVTDPEGPARLARFGSAEERERILADWNGTRTPYPDSTVVAAFEEQVRATPAAPAVEFEGEVIGYAELDRRAGLVSRRLNATAGSGFVGIHLERSVELVVAILGVLKAGLAYVPLDPELPADRVRYMVEDSGAATVLCRPEDVEALSRPGVVALTVEQAVEEPGEESGEQSERPEITGDTPVYLIYTSGSTGRPKGVLNRHAGVFNTVHWRRRRFPLGPADRVLQKTPFGFDVSAWEFLWPLVSGACLVVARPGGHRDTRYLKRTIRDRGVTVVHFVPSMLDAFLEEDDLAGHCGSLRLVFASGEALAPPTVRAFFRELDCELHNLYGPTEASIEVSHWQAAPDFAGRDVPIGRPIANTGLYVVDEQLEPVPVGVAGELCIGGVQVALGYHRQPELTRERFVADPFTPGGRLYRTGDLARYRTDGQIEYLGRLDDQVKISGFRIEPGEIETVLRGLPGVGQAAVLPVGEDGARRLAAFVVPDRPGAIDPGAFDPGAFDPEACRAALARALPAYMVPKQFTALEALPTSTNGKLDRRALAELARPARPADPARATPAPAPASVPAPADEAGNAGNAGNAEDTEDIGPDLETTLRALFAQSLGVAEVGLHEDYFELGGHSLAAVKLATRIRAALGVDLDVWTLFDFPTVAELARELARPL